MRNTRMARARELERRLVLGPAFRIGGHPTLFTPAEAASQYRRWVESWVLPEVCALVPELKRPKETKQ